MTHKYDVEEQIKNLTTKAIIEQLNNERIEIQVGARKRPSYTRGLRSQCVLKVVKDKIIPPEWNENL